MAFLQVSDPPTSSTVQELAEAVQRHRGQVVKTSANDLMLAWRGVPAALRALAEAAAAEPSLRAGLAAGDVDEEGGDYFGMPVNVAKRLCDAAEPGTVLVAPGVEDLADGALAHVPSRRRALELKGLAGVVDALEPDLTQLGRGDGASTLRMTAVLVTDLVSSTALLSRLGLERFEEQRSAHFAVLRDTAAALGGTELLNTGDGLVFGFASVGEACLSAVTMQRTVEREARRAAHPLRIRVALEVAHLPADVDPSGADLGRLHAVCALAAPDQILASGSIPALLGTRRPLGFRRQGEGSSAAWDLPWRHVPPRELSLPSGLSDTGRPLLGRASQLTHLHLAFDRVRRGKLETVLIVGEPGVGKSRLASEFCRELHGDGAAVLVGHCTPDSAVAYEPFVEALRDRMRSQPVDELAYELGSDAGWIGRFVPDLLERLPHVQPPRSFDEATDRHRLFDAVANVLEEIARPAGLAILVEDLHWADQPTLLLLSHLAQHSGRGGILLLATARDEELPARPGLPRLLQQLRRAGRLTRIDLPGLAPEDVVALLEGLSGHTLDRQGNDLAEALHEETAGNPLFIEEVLRHLVETGVLYRDGDRWRSDATSWEDLGVPDGVKEVIAERMRRFDRETQRLLTLAGLIGRRFDARLLVHLSGMDEVDVVEHLEEPLEANLVFEVDGSPFTFAFSHALVRDALYDELSRSRRAVLHRRTGEAIEAVFADRLEPHLAALAHHFLQAGSTEPALRYLQLAAEQSLAVFAYEEAAIHYARAVQLAQDAGLPETERGSLLVKLARAQWRAGEAATATESARQAATLARRAGDRDLLADAALVAEAGWVPAGLVNAHVLGLVTEAVREYGAGDSQTRARLLALQAVHAYYADRLQEADLRSSEALRMARSLGDPPTLARAINARSYVLRQRAEFIAERLTLGDELLGLVDALGDREIAAMAHHWRGLDLLERGEIEAARESLAALAALAEETRRPQYRFWAARWAAALAIAAGELEEAAGRLTAMRELGRRADDPNTELQYFAASTQLTLHGLPREDLEPVRDALDPRYAGWPIWTVLRGWSLLALGDVNGARGEISGLVGENLTLLREDAFRTTGLLIMGDIVAAAGDGAAAVDLHRALTGLRDRIGVGTAGVVILGPVRIFLGRLAATLGDTAAAVPDLEAGLSQAERCGLVVAAREAREALSALRSG